MDNTREKLIELVKQNTAEFVNPYAYECGEDAERFADHLIANGVTVQKWIAVSERLPEEDGEVLVYTEGEYEISLWDGEAKVFRFWDGWWCGDLNVTHWMPLPEAPKGE